ncbi:MAG: ferrous iron transport protein A [Spirochaetes bacterium]|nr:ferrous iron transport protein A [Spirochaetota bacterium]MBU0954916.1 ferrous iron transport protein A [Spirochaetota bacterium]
MMLAELRAYDRFKVLAIHTGRETGRRLADMGFTKDSEGRVMRCGFLRGPMHVCVGGYHLLLRHSEAAAVEVEVLEFAPHGHGLGRGGRRGLRRGFGHGALSGKPGLCHGCETDAAAACQDSDAIRTEPSAT